MREALELSLRAPPDAQPERCVLLTQAEKAVERASDSNDQVTAARVEAESIQGVEEELPRLRELVVCAKAWLKHNKDDATVKVTMLSVQGGLWKIPVYENTKKLNVHDPILRFVPPPPLPEAKKPRT